MLHCSHQALRALGAEGLHALSAPRSMPEERAPHLDRAAAAVGQLRKSRRVQFGDECDPPAKRIRGLIIINTSEPKPPI